MDAARTTPDIGQLRKRFVVAEDDFAHAELASLIERTSEFCVLDEQGNVHLRRRDLPQGKRLGFCLLARFIGSRMDPKFSPIVNAAELSTFLGVGKPEIAARAKDLVDEGFAVRCGKGKYRINVARIEDFLESLAAQKSRGA